MRRFWSLASKTASEWNRHDAPRLGAALAFYTVLSIAPLVVVTIAVAGMAFGDEAARGQIAYQIRDIVGGAGARVIQEILKSARHAESGILATIAGAFTLLVGASAVFRELRSSMNRIWDVPEATSFTLRGTIRAYLGSFAMVLAVGFLLLVSLILTTAIEIFVNVVSTRLPEMPFAIQVFNFIVSFMVVTLLFALIYKFVPDTRVRWRNVWHGAIVTAILFTIGKSALALYIAKAGVGSAYGAAGSIVALLVWVYYSAQIFFLGAEFTHIYALDRGDTSRSLPGQLGISTAAVSGRK